MIIKNILNVSFFNFLSKAIGFVRDYYIAFAFGASIQATFIIIALELKNLFLPIFHNLNFEKNLIYQYYSIKNIELKINFFKNIFFIFTIILMFLTLVFWFNADIVFSFLYPGLENNFFQEKKFFLIKASLICNLLNFVVVYYSSIFQAQKSFLLNSFLLIFPNLSLFFFLSMNYLFFTNENFYKYINHFLMVSGILQISIIIFFKNNLFVKYFFDFSNLKKKIIDFKFFFVLYAPTLFAVILLKFYQIFEKFFLSFKEDLIPLFYISQKIAFVPSTIIIAAITTVLMPEFSTIKENKNINIYLLNISLKFLLILSLYFTLFFITFADFFIPYVFTNAKYTLLQLGYLIDIFIKHSLSLIFFSTYSLFYVFLISQSELKYIFRGILYSFILSFLYMYLIYLTDSYDYFAFSLLIFYAFQSLYLLLKINFLNDNKLKEELLKSFNFYISLLILIIFTIFIHYYDFASFLSILLTCIIIGLHLFLSLKFNLIKIDEFLYLFKKIINKLKKKLKIAE